MQRRPVVTIVQRRLTDYRVPLFESLRRRLDASGVGLRLLHGDPTPEEARKNDSGTLDWAQHLPTRYLLGGHVCWQPFARLAQGSDLVIVTQENKLVHNLGALLVRRWPRLAFWGHGRNLQSTAPHGWRERFKRMTTCRVDWWFAYTSLTQQMLLEDGYPADRITVVNNSIDTSQLRTLIEAARLQDRESLRISLGLAPDAVVGLFIGSLYPVKRIPMLLQAAEALNARHPRFQLLVAGDGEQRALVEAAGAQPGSAVRYVGRATGERKAALLAAADLFLHPGGLGLSVLDAFVAGLPIVTTESAPHGPEIAYLQHGHNGLISADTLGEFVDLAGQLVGSPAMRTVVAQAALQSAAEYTVEGMAEKFSVGIRDALGKPSLRCHQ